MSKSPRNGDCGMDSSSEWAEKNLHSSQWKPAKDLTVKQMKDLLGSKVSSAKGRADVVKIYEKERTNTAKSDARPSSARQGGCGCANKDSSEAYGKVRKGGCGCALKHAVSGEAYGSSSRMKSPRTPVKSPRTSTTAKGISRKTDINTLIKQISEYDFKDAVLNIDITIPVKTSMMERKETTTVHIGEFYEKDSGKEDDGHITVKVISSSSELIKDIFEKLQPLLK